MTIARFPTVIGRWNAVFLLVIVSWSVRNLWAAELSTQKSLTFEHQSQWLALSQGGCVTVESGQIAFTSPQGASTQTLVLDGREVIVGDHEGKTVGVLVYADGHPHSLDVAEFQLYDVEGNQLLALAEPGFSSAIIAPSGTGFVGIGGAEGLRESLLRFYGLNGILIDTLRVSFFEGGEYSRDGSHFLFETAAEGLQVASSEGEIQKQYGISPRWAASADAQVVAVSTDTSVTVHRDGGRTTVLGWPASYGAIRQLTISSDGLFMAIWSATQLSFFRTDSMVLLWSHTIAESSWNYRSCDIVSDGARIVIGLDFDPGKASPERHQKSRCIVYDADGAQIATADSAPIEWSASYPIVRFIDDGRVLLLDKDRAQWLTLE